MKLTNYTVIILLVSLTLTTKAQRVYPKNKPIEYIDIDRQNDTGYYTWKLKYNHPYIVRLNNVNRFVYANTKGEQTGTSLFSTPPAAFTGIKLPGFFNSYRIDRSSQEQANNIQSLTENNKTCRCITPDEVIALELSELHARLVVSLNTIISSGKLFNSIREIQDSLVALKTDIIHSWDKGDYNINSRKNNLLIRYQAAINDRQQNSLLKGYRNILISSESLYTSIGKMIDTLTEKLNNKLESTLCFDSTYLVRRLACLDPCKNAKSYYQALDSLIILRKCVELFAKKVSSLNEDLARAKQMVTEMKEVDKAGTLSQIQKDYDLISKENFTYIIETFLADKDVHDISFNIAAAEPVGLNQPQNRIIRVKGITTGGLKLDFSTGVFMNFGNNNFLGPDYYYKQIDSVNKQIIEAERSKKLMFSLGAFAHLYWRMYSYIKPALSLGVSTTPSFDNVNLHAGISLLLGTPGSPNRIVISGGVTLREVSLLDKRYSLNTNYKGLPDAVPVSKSFPQAGSFIAVTYNLFTPAAK